MNADFPRILSLLRKEKGISQKNAAKQLQISQSLLSHYEKGIRECGLAFVVKAANFYDVSCDYLLGQSPERKGTTLTFNDLNDPSEQKEVATAKTLKILYRKKILLCSINLMLNLLAKSKNTELINHIFNFLNFAVYRAFRILFRINKKNNNEMFVVPDDVANQMALSEMVKIECLANNLAKNENDSENSLQINNQILEQTDCANHNALLNLIKNCEIELANNKQNKN